MLRSVQRKGQKEASAMASISSLKADLRDVMLGGLCRDFTDSTLITGKGNDDVGVLQLPLSGALLVTSPHGSWVDRKSTRLNSSHVKISYAVFCVPREFHCFPTRRSSDLRRKHPQWHR